MQCPAEEAAYAGLSYNPATGLFYRHGRPAGTVNAGGYVVLRLAGKLVYAHRLALALVNGYWPTVVDHMNGDRSDNKIFNLRDTSGLVNAQNRGLRITPSGLPAGCHFHAPTGRFKSAVCSRGKQTHLGYFDRPDEASAAYAEAKAKQHKDWTRNDKIIPSKAEVSG